MGHVLALLRANLTWVKINAESLVTMISVWPPAGSPATWQPTGSIMLASGRKVFPLCPTRCKIASGSTNHERMTSWEIHS